jgi:hypothetical protein
MNADQGAEQALPHGAALVFAHYLAPGFNNNPVIDDHGCSRADLPRIFPRRGTLLRGPAELLRSRCLLPDFAWVNILGGAVVGGLAGLRVTGSQSQYDCAHRTNPHHGASFSLFCIKVWITHTNPRLAPKNISCTALFLPQITPRKGGAEHIFYPIHQIKAPSSFVARARPVARIKVKRTVSRAFFEPISLQRTAIVARQGM